MAMPTGRSEARKYADSIIESSRGVIADGAKRGERCAKLLKNVMRDLPPTDIRAEAIEAADAVLAWCAEVRS